MVAREKYFHDLDRDQWRDLLHSHGLSTRQELKQLHRNRIIRTIVKVIIALSFLLLSFNSDTTAGIIVFVVFILWCVYMAGWILYMNWPRKSKVTKENLAHKVTDGNLKEPPDEFDIEQIL
jgi:hypothetical protein